MINLEYTVRILYGKILNIHIHSPNRVPGKSTARLRVLEGTANCLSSGLRTKSALGKEAESLYAVSVMLNMVSENPKLL